MGLTSAADQYEVVRKLPCSLTVAGYRRTVPTRTIPYTTYSCDRLQIGQGHVGRGGHDPCTAHESAAGFS